MKTISFVIPVYNEAKRLSKTFKALEELRLPRGLALSGAEGLKLEEVIFVDDGSIDNSKFKIGNSKLEKRYTLKVISYTPNQGKGFALKMGMLASKSDYTLFFDADVATPLFELYKFIPYMENETDIIAGVRKNGVSMVIRHQPLIREVLGNTFTKFATTFLGLKAKDITCGFKAFSRSARGPIFSQTVINGWGCDAEILLLGQKLKFSKAEVPVLWAHDPNSKVKLHKAIPQTLLDLLLIKWHHEVKKIFHLFPNLKIGQLLNQWKMSIGKGKI